MNSVQALHDAGYALLRQGRLLEAKERFQEVLSMDAAHVDAHVNMGYLESELGRPGQAISWYERALAIEPLSVNAHNGVGTLHLGQGKLAEAFASYERALQIDAQHADSYNNFGSALVQAKRPEEAEQRFRQALALNPGHPEALVNLGNLLEERGALVDAVASLEQAVRCCPEWPEGHLSLGSAFHDIGDFDRAIASYRRALALAPNHIRAHVYLGLSLLAQGEWRRGWDEYEWRWHSKVFQERIPAFWERLWEGEDLAGRRLLVHAEQGFGDTLQFVRYLPRVKRAGGDIILRCQPQLTRLLQGIEGADRVVGDDECLPEFDLQAPLMSLGRIFRTAPNNVPATVPYLTADSESTVKWSQLLPRDGFRVGLIWAGNPAKVKDRFRSLTLSALRPLGELAGVSLIGLQPESGESDPASKGMAITMLGAKLRDFADTAAVVSQLDLVITADTAMAHLAGALGRPVWILLSAAPDWRWLSSGRATPWYPTASLFRQRQLGDWTVVVQQVASELRRVLREGQVVDPSPEAHVVAGDSLLQRGGIQAAVAHYREALDLRPAHVPAHWGLGRAFRSQGRLAEAAASFAKVLTLTPAAPNAKSRAPKMVGDAQASLRRLATRHRSALKCNPATATTQWELGQVLESLDRIEEAASCYEQAVAIDPAFVPGLVSLGWARMEQGELSEATVQLEQAIAVAPSCAEAHFGLANALLLRGDLQRGWCEYEWRWRSTALSPFLGVRAGSLKPAWNGEDLTGKAILLHAEQGLGDTLQFVRYAPLIAKRGARVIIGCQPELKRLLASMPGIGEPKASGERLYSPEPLIHAPLLSLPRIFGTTLDSIPTGVYLRPPEELVRKWQATFDNEKRLKVGLVWAGGLFNPRNRQRSIALQTLAPLVRVPGIAWFGLQTGESARVAPDAGLELANLGPNLNDFADTAAVMSYLDLVITVDTAAAHLAGALGRPAWVLLAHVPDWRWLLGRLGSPWYPTTMRLFRQPRPGDWQHVVEEAAQALANLTAQRRRSRR